MIHSDRRLLGVVGWLVAGVVLVVGMGGERAPFHAVIPNSGRCDCTRTDAVAEGK
jgi:hypothetical protein